MFYIEINWTAVSFIFTFYTLYTTLMLSDQVLVIASQLDKMLDALFTLGQLFEGEGDKYN